MASTYAAGLKARQAQERIGNWPGNKRTPPGWVLDLAAEEKLTGKYRTKPDKKGRVRNPICPSCHTAKSATGGCWCE